MPGPFVETGTQYAVTEWTRIKSLLFYVALEIWVGYKTQAFLSCVQASEDMRLIPCLSLNV